jgi:hypothetical protein
MFMKKTTNGFPKLSSAEFTQRLGVIISSMANNAKFVSLSAQVDVLITKANAYYILDAKAAKGDRDVLLARKASRQDITDFLHRLGFSVSAIASGNAEVLSSSGFPFSKDAQKTNPMFKPEPPRVSSGTNNGDIDCRTSTQKGMKTVNYYISSDESSLTDNSSTGWTVISSNSTKFTFSNLNSGQRYYMKVGLVGVRGQEVVSDPISYIPQ